MGGMAEREPGQPCRPCEMLWGTIGVIAGLALLFMGLDLLTGQGLTRRISGSAPEPSFEEDE